MGGEGHINSLFPHTAAVREAERMVIGVTDSPKPPPRRITLTLPAVRRSREVWLVVSGDAKADAVALGFWDDTRPDDNPPVDAAIFAIARCSGAKDFFPVLDEAFLRQNTIVEASMKGSPIEELNALGGPQPLFDLLTNLGIRTLGDDASVSGLGLTLGNAPVCLLDLTNAYATLARQGRYFPPILFPSKFDVGRSMFDAQSAWLIADILSDQNARAPSFQPGGPLDFPFPCAVKTGTSSDFHDNWCIGFTPDFTVGVWAGNFEQQPMKGLSGIAGAGPIFHRAMERIHRTNKPRWFSRPDGLVDIAIDARNGKRLWITKTGLFDASTSTAAPWPTSRSSSTGWPRWTPRSAAPACRPCTARG